MFLQIGEDNAEESWKQTLISSRQGTSDKRLLQVTKLWCGPRSTTVTTAAHRMDPLCTLDALGKKNPAWRFPTTVRRLAARLQHTLQHYSNTLESTCCKIGRLWSYKPRAYNRTLWGPTEIQKERTVYTYIILLYVFTYTVYKCICVSPLFLAPHVQLHVGHIAGSFLNRQPSFISKHFEYHFDKIPAG